MSDNKTIREHFDEQLDLIHENEELKKRIEKEKAQSEELSAKLESTQRQLNGLRESLKSAEEKCREAEQKAEQIRAAAGTAGKKGKSRLGWKLFKLVFVMILLGSVIYYYEEELNTEEDRSERLWEEKEEYRGKAEFMDDYVVIIEDDIYHRYGCEELNLDSFTVRNILAAENSSRYAPCPVCIGEE